MRPINALFLLSRVENISSKVPLWSSRFHIVPNDKKNGIFSEIRNLIVKTSPAIKKEESTSRCIILWGCPKIRKSRRWRQTRRQKNRTSKKAASAFLQFAAGVLFLLDNYLKEEKHTYLNDISEHNKAFSMQG